LILLRKYFSLLLLLSSLPSLSCSNLAQQGAISSAYQAYGQGNCGTVLKNLSDAEKYAIPSPSIQAEIFFLRAQCFEKLSQVNNAIGLYEYIVKTFPESAYAAQAEGRLREHKIVITQLTNPQIPSSPTAISHERRLALVT